MFRHIRTHYLSKQASLSRYHERIDELRPACSMPTAQTLEPAALAKSMGVRNTLPVQTSDDHDE